MAFSRPQREHCRRGRGAQRAHRAAPSPSRLTTGLTSPQRAQAVASWRRRQRAHTPPSDDAVNGQPVRPHRTHIGSGSNDPRARSSTTRRPTAGGAPTPSASASSASTRAITTSAAPWTPTAAMASAMTCSASSGATSVTRCVTTCTRSAWSCCRVGLTVWRRRRPWPGGAGCRAPPPAKAALGPRRLWWPCAPARSARPACSRRCRTTRRGW